jgi:type III secretion protein R
MNPIFNDPFVLAAVLGALALLPLAVVSMTCFLKVAVVMMLLRNALSVQQVPPSIALYAIALALSGYVMAPTLQTMTDRFTRMQEAPRTPSAALAVLAETAEPLRVFMKRHTSEKELAWFEATAKTALNGERVAAPARDSYSILVPAFMISELQRAFEIGFLLYVPFVVVELVVASILMALGMQSVSSQVITTPLKILLFIMLDGWSRLLHALALSYT